MIKLIKAVTHVGIDAVISHQRSSHQYYLKGIFIEGNRMGTQEYTYSAVYIPFDSHEIDATSGDAETLETCLGSMSTSFTGFILLFEK